MRSKLTIIKEFCEKRNPSILIASETHTTNEFNAELDIHGYKINRVDSSSSHTGGVAIYVKNGVIIQNVNISSMSKTWIISLDIVSSKKLKIMGIYKSPVEKIDVFLDNLKNHIEKFVKSDDEIIAVGDININVARKSLTSDKYNNLISSFGLKQIIKEYTREDLKRKTRTIIDHVITNVNGVKCVINKSDKISDHYLIEIYLNKRIMKCNIVETKFKCIKNYSKEKLYEEMESILESKEYDLDNLIDVVKECTNRFVVEKTMSHNKKFWFSDKLKVLKRIKNDLYIDYAISNDEVQYIKFEKAYKDYKYELKLAESKMIQRELEKNKTDPKRLWKILKSLYKDDKVIIDKIVHNDVLITSPIEIANIMNRSFVESVTSITNNIPHSNQMNYLNSIEAPNTGFKFNDLDLCNLKLVVASLNDKSFIDLVSGRTISDLMLEEKYAKLILSCINKSINDCIIPSQLKCSLISPIAKVNNPMKFDEYRPVNNLPVFDKIIETIVLEQVQQYLKKEKILSNDQHGFREKHNCETAVLTLINKWINNIEDNKVIITVFLDFKRAFETVNRDILLEKLKRYGFGNHEVRWFGEFLSGRSQQTIINGILSDVEEVNIGVPQGSKLSNLLFILYINDIVKLSNEVEFVMYADDTSITAVGNTIYEASEKINKVLNTVDDWLKFNRIAINSSKCKYIVANCKDDINIDINVCGETLERVNNYKYLGVIFDSKLKFNEHADSIIKKLDKKLGFMWRTKNKLNYNSRITYFKSLVLPHFDICASILMMCDKGKLDEMEKIQRRFVRLILNDKNNEMSELYDKMKIVPVENRIRTNVLKLIDKLVRYKVPLGISNEFIEVKTIKSRTLRNADCLNCKSFKKQAACRSIFFNGIIEYNKLKNYIKNCKLEKCNFIKSCILYCKNNSLI